MTRARRHFRPDPIGNRDGRFYHLYARDSFRAIGLRIVGDVEPDLGRGWRQMSAARHGWYDNPEGESTRDGDGLVWGVVYQLPARRGHARFIAGYQHGSTDAGPTLDLSTVYTATVHASVLVDGDDAIEEARVSAAAAADSMARAAAEGEREYREAWQAGVAYADATEEESAARATLCDLFQERGSARAIRNAAPAIWREYHHGMRRARDTIERARHRREELAKEWRHRRRDLAAAFNDGACTAVV